jgi:hypothetical protein
MGGSIGQTSALERSTITSQLKDMLARDVLDCVINDLGRRCDLANQQLRSKDVALGYAGVYATCNATLDAGTSMALVGAAS